MMAAALTLLQAQHKIEQYCAYQERCHEEVVTKLRSMHLASHEIDQLMVHLIEQNFLNEARFACSFARGKHRIKFWGKIRITNELKIRHINNTLITLALQEISPEEYWETFNTIAERNWHSITEKNGLKKRKKFCDFLLRKGFESNLVYEKMKELDS